MARMASSEQDASGDPTVNPTVNPTAARRSRRVAEFHVVGRIQRYGPSKYAVTVESFSAVDGRAQLPEDILAEMCRNVVEAQAALRRLTVALGVRIRERGGEVLTVETDDQSWGA